MIVFKIEYGDCSTNRWLAEVGVACQVSSDAWRGCAPPTAHPTRQSIAPRPRASKNALALLNEFDPKNPTYAESGLG